jgi:DNA-binding response OmpR family regulator
MRALYIARQSDSALVRALAEIGCKVDTVDSSAALWAIVENSGYTIIVYEQPESDIGHFKACAEVKPQDTMMLAIVDDSRTETRVALLRMGADGCLVRPLSFIELGALLQAYIRRRQANGDVLDGRAAKVPMANQSAADLRIDLKTRRVSSGQRVLELSSGEFRLLALLARAAGMTLDRQSIWQQLWDDETEISGPAIDVAVSRLRRKLAKTPVDVLNVRNIGYRLSGRFWIG